MKISRKLVVKAEITGGYIVVKAVNTTEHNPDSRLSKEAVDRMIVNGWTVEIVKG